MYNPFDLPDEYLIEMGRIVVAWSRLEGTLDRALVKFMGTGSLSGVDNMLAGGLVVTAHMAFPQKLTALKTFFVLLTRDKKHPLIKQFDQKVNPSIANAQRQRNKVMHSGWFTSDGKKVFYSTFSARGELKLDTKFINSKYIVEAHQKIHEAADTLDICLSTFAEFETARRAEFKQTPGAL